MSKKSHRKKVLTILISILLIVFGTTLLWSSLDSIVGIDNALKIKLSFAHAMGPQFVNEAPLNTELVKKVNILIDPTDLSSKSNVEIKAEFQKGKKDYPIKFSIENISDETNKFFSVINVLLRKNSKYENYTNFVIMPASDRSQFSRWLSQELAQLIGYQNGNILQPINLSVNNNHIGLRYINPLASFGSYDFSKEPYTKLFCRVSKRQATQQVQLTGADISKAAVGPDAEWRIVAPTLGEGVTGPEFTKLIQSAIKEDLNTIRELIDLKAFGEYVAIYSIANNTNFESMPTPATFVFEHISGTLKPSYYICDAGGLYNKQDVWFSNLIKLAVKDASFISAYNSTLKFLNENSAAREKLNNLSSIIINDIKPSIKATAYKYVANRNREDFSFVYNLQVNSEIKKINKKLIAPSKLKKLKVINQNLKTKEQELIVLEGNKLIDQDLTINSNQKLVIKAGSAIAIKPGKSIIISGGQLTAEGTKELPITIDSQSSDPFGAIILKDEAQAELQNTTIKNGADAYKNYVKYEGMLSVHNSKIELENVEISSGMLSLQASKAKLTNVTFKNLTPLLFLSSKSIVQAKNLQHQQLPAVHTQDLVAKTAHGLPHNEREFKYAILAAWDSTQLKTVAEELQKYLASILADKSKWLAPEFALDGKGFRADEKVGEFAYVDIYVDTKDRLNYKHDVSYRFRNRFENLITHDSYIKSPWLPQYWPFRLEYQGKIGRGHSAPGFSEVYEARFELRKQTLPFSEDYLAPWSPWDTDTYLPFMLSGLYKNIATISGQEVYKYLNQQTGQTSFAFEPVVAVITERLRQHLNIKTEWGSGPNPDQSNIITMDRSEIFDAQDYLDYYQNNKYGDSIKLKPSPVAIITEMEIEFERNVSRELDKRLIQAEKDGNQAEVLRLTRARDAFVADLSTLRQAIVNFFKGKSVEVIPANDSKYLQSYNLLTENQKNSRIASLNLNSERIVLKHNADKQQVNQLLQLLLTNSDSRGLKFTFSTDQVLTVSMLNWQQVSHDQLGRGRDIQSAGYLQIPDKTSPFKLEINNRSGDYCPSLASLDLVKDFILQRTDKSLDIIAKNEPNEKCL